MWYTIKEAAAKLGCNPKVLINLKYRNGLDCETCVPYHEIDRLSRLLVNGHMPHGNRFCNSKFSKRKRKDKIDKIVEKVLERLSCNERFQNTVDRTAEEFGCSDAGISDKMTIGQVEKAMILNAVRTIKNRAEIARRLGISRRNLYRKLKQYRIPNIIDK
jgi:AraC-like DNA-binding protein